MDGDLMDTKLSKVIVEYINKCDYEENMKKFLVEILEFELEYQLKYDQDDKKGQHEYSEFYQSKINKGIGDS